MCKKRNSKNAWIPHQKKIVKVDSCIANLIHALNGVGYKTLACCCGHGIYNMSIVVENTEDCVWEILSGTPIYRKKRFYVKDKQGFYFIPEIKKVKLG